MSINHWNGKMPAPHEHIEIRVTRWRDTIEVAYKATQEQLRAAGIVDSFMEEKIKNQTRGAKLNANGIKFVLRARRAEWIAGISGATRILFEARHAEGAITLAGIREMFPDGIPDWEEPEVPKAPWVTVVDDSLRRKQRQIGRYQRVVEWASCGNVIWPNWPRVSAEAYRATR